MLTLLFDGIAYGMLLFVLAVGLAVTLGLMNFINLAHGAFAMVGGYVAVLSMNRAGVPFLATLPIAFLATAALGAVPSDALSADVSQAASRPGAVLDRAGVHGRGHDRLVRWARSSRTSGCRRSSRVGSRSVASESARYRLFIVAVCAVITLMLQWVLSRTRFGSRLRAAVDDPRVASGLGIDVDRVFRADLRRRVGVGRPRRRARGRDPRVWTRRFR